VSRHHIVLVILSGDRDLGFIRRVSMGPSLAPGLVSQHHMVLVNPGPFGSKDLYRTALVRASVRYLRAGRLPPGGGQPPHVVQDPKMLFHLKRRAVGVSGAQAGEQPTA
jgi:hypothetical protein